MTAITGSQSAARWSFLALVLSAVALVGLLVPRGTLFRFLEHEPFTLLFLVMAAGYALGKVTLKGLSLGPTAGSLVVAIGLSFWASARHGVELHVPAFASVVFFNLFMFAIGMKVGPQFFAGLDRGAWRYVLLAVLVPLSAAALTLLLQVLVGPPKGVAAGLFAGANTATPGLAAATAAFESGAVPLPEGANQSAVLQDMSTAFACSYCVSTVVFVIFLKMLPGLFRRDPIDEARAFERAMGAGGAPLPGGSAAFLASALPVQQRTYRVVKTDLVGKSLGELRSEQSLVAIDRIERAGASVPLADERQLELGDHVTLFARVPLLIEAAERLGPEFYDAAASPPPLQTVEVVPTNPAVTGRKLFELVKDVGHGLYLNALFRSGHEIPRGSEVIVHKGDVLRVTSTPERLAPLEEKLGPVVQSSLSTDILTLALGLSMGALLGSVKVPLGSVKLALGSLGLLLVGIALSTLRTRNPALGGPFPEPARQLLEDLGLNVFVVILGLGSGSGLIRALEAGAFLPLLLGALVVGLLPPLGVWALGLRGLKMNTAELLGAVAGARCSGSALSAAQEASQSTVPAVAYPVTYALSNVLFTLLSYALAWLK